MKPLTGSIINHLILIFICRAQAVYKYYHSDGSLTLQHFIVIFGAFELFLSQLPDIHSLRWVNALCTLSTIGFAGTTIGVTIYNGKYASHTRPYFLLLISLTKLRKYISPQVPQRTYSSWLIVPCFSGKNIDRSSVSYSLQGSSSFKMFKAFNALGTIAFSFGDAMLPEIQVKYALVIQSLCTVAL